MEKNTIEGLVKLMKDNKETSEFIIEWLTSIIKDSINGYPTQLNIDGGFKYYHDKAKLDKSS